MILASMSRVPLHPAELRWHKVVAGWRLEGANCLSMESWGQSPLLEHRAASTVQSIVLVV